MLLTSVVGEPRGVPLHPLCDLCTLCFLDSQKHPFSEFRCSQEKKVARRVFMAAILDFTPHDHQILLMS